MELTLPYDEEIARRVRNALAEATTLTIIEKKMFGGLVFMVNGAMTLGVDNDDLIVRCGVVRAEKSLDSQGVRAFDLAGGKNMRGWVMIDPTGTRNSKALKKWIDLALRFNQELGGSEHPSKSDPSAQARVSRKSKLQLAKRRKS